METQVLIIGGGATGTGIARDLSLRGVQCMLVEKVDINTGASGANHGLLHSGARYVSTDPEVAKECREEGERIKLLAPHCIENTGGLFVAVEGDEEKYIADFPHLCSNCGILTQTLDIKEAREFEPVLSKKLIAAYLVKDATIDPFKLSLENISQAKELGTILLLHTKVIGFKRSGGKIQTTSLKNIQTGEKIVIKAEQVINATGAWANEVAALAGVSIPMFYSKGSILVTDGRITKHVVNRLRPPSDGDILSPGGTVSILGTTSIRVESPDNTRPTFDEVDLIVNEGSTMSPVLEKARYIRAYAGVRALITDQNENNDRSISRGFTLLDHEQDGLENFITITGGKLTTYRLMAEKTADLVCQRLGNHNSCLTRTQPLPSTNAGRWTEPGFGAKQWLQEHDPEDLLLCECQMLPKSVIDSVLEADEEQKEAPSLMAIGLRSRIGKGPCQGTFCGARVIAHMYDKGKLHSDMGLNNLKDFLRGRWMGERPVLWDGQLIQAELKEALYCGFLGLEI